MQQLYRCWSWWIANPEKEPVLIFEHHKKTLDNAFITTFFDIAQKEINLRIVKQHDGPYVQPKDTGMWDNDIEITDYAMFDPERKLRQIFAPHIPNHIPDPPCDKKNRSTRRLPKIAILNRNTSRELLNAKELATSIEETFPGQTVQIVYFESKTMIEQVQFFMESDIVISPHGAQLTGIAFMKNCSTLVEFFPRDYVAADYFGSLAASVGINHKYFYLGENEDQIQSYEKYHYLPTYKFRDRSQCPNMVTVMDALVKVIQHWRPCCSIAGSSSAQNSQQYQPRNQLKAKLQVIPPNIDIISVGSLSRNDNLDTQKHTFGSHRSVRNFFQITELDDEDKGCFLDLTFEQYQKVISSCKSTKGQSSTSKEFRTALFRPMNNSTEWLCEQKRPIDGLHQTLEKYKSGQTTIPDYLFLINDDTYLNMDALVKTLEAYYPPGDNHLVAGCTFLGLPKPHFVFPRAGMGAIFTRATIEKIMMPIHCRNADETLNPFVQWTCWRLQQNLFGEALFFKEGMSIGDLMKSYAKELSFTKVDEWRSTGYCFHGDHALGYFFNYYHVSVPDWILAETIPTDKIRKLFSFKKLADSPEERHTGKGGECDNAFEKCTAKSRICHYVDAEQMSKLYTEQQYSTAK